LYLRGDPYEYSDSVFGVKDSLVVSLGEVSAEEAKQYDVKEGSKILRHNFVLVTDKQSADLRNEKSMQALKALGRRCKIVDGLPVPDLD
jgi:hypothetical protein